MDDEIKNFKKSFPLNKFKEVKLARGEFETGMILAKSTVSVKEFFRIHYQSDMKRPCYVNMAEYISTEFGNDYVFELSGCAVCPFKTPINELMEYYPKDSYAWCPIYDVRSKYGLLGIPNDRNVLQKILQRYLELQKLILKHKVTNDSGDLLSMQDFLDEIIERLKR